jgi:GTPase SAR1 family protein
MKGPDNLYLFLIDITDSARADEALHDLAFLLRSAEAKYVAVVFNKCDLKPWEDPEVQEVVARVKEVVQLYKSDVKFQCDVYDDLTKFSVATGEQTDVLLDRLAHVAAAKKKNVHQSLVAKKQQPIANPEPPRPSKEELLEKIHLSHANSMLPPAEFMSQMVAGELENWDHRSHLRAGFLTLLECLHKKSVVVDATDLFLDRLDRMLKSAPGKFRNTSHRYVHQTEHPWSNCCSSVPSR